MPNNYVLMISLPPCDICGEPAAYDAKIPGAGWGYVCQTHFKQHKCKLGTGFGQALVVPFDSLQPAIQKKAINNVRRNIADEEGKCSMTDNEIIQYIHDGDKTFYGTGEAL